MPACLLPPAAISGGVPALPHHLLCVCGHKAADRSSSHLLHKCWVTVEWHQQQHAAAMLTALHKATPRGQCYTAEAWVSGCGPAVCCVLVVQGPVRPRPCCCCCLLPYDQSGWGGVAAAGRQAQCGSSSVCVGCVLVDPVFMYVCQLMCVAPWQCSVLGSWMDVPVSVCHAGSNFKPSDIC